MRKIFAMMALSLLSFGLAQAAAEIYGVYSDNDQVFTIYYDNNKTSRGGVIPDDWIVWNEYKTRNKKVKTVVFASSMQYASPRSTKYWFSGFKALEKIENIYNLNTSDVSDMSGMFLECESLQSIDLSNFVTTYVTNMSSMFNQCKSLTSININSFDITHVTNLSGMFAWDENLTTIYCKADWSSYYQRKQSDDMFLGCTKLAGDRGTVFDSNQTDIRYAKPDGSSFDPGYFSRENEIYAVMKGYMLQFYYDDERITRGGVPWATSSLRYMIDHSEPYEIALTSTMRYARPEDLSYWFNGFKNVEFIQNLDLLNTSNVTDMSLMFAGCSKLPSVDISHFDMSKVTDVHGMFNGCSSLVKIYCEEDWTQKSNIAYSFNLFYGCTALKGGKGTPFDATQIDIQYARPDGDYQAPGYFWRKGDTGQDIESVQPSAISSQKIIRNGQLFIERNGKIFNAQGAEIK